LRSLPPSMITLFSRKLFFAFNARFRRPTSSPSLGIESVCIISMKLPLGRGNQCCPHIDVENWRPICLAFRRAQLAWCNSYPPSFTCVAVLHFCGAHRSYTRYASYPIHDLLRICMTTEMTANVIVLYSRDAAFSANMSKLSFSCTCHRCALNCFLFQLLMGFWKRHRSSSPDYISVSFLL
jgi:hypothetical protein